MDQRQVADGFEKLWRWARWLLLSAAIGLQSLQVCYIGNYHHGFFNPDKAAQIAAARGLLDGHGLSCPGANSADASAPFRCPLTQWPMGYSLLFAALWPLLGNLWNTAVAVELLATVLFFTSWLAILQWLGPWLRPSVKLLLMSYWTFVWNPLNLLTGPEMMAQALFCWGLAFCLLAAAGRRLILSSVASSLCVAAAASFRYAYWPLVAVVPASLAVACWFGPHRRRLMLGTAVASALTAVLFLAVTMLQRFLTGYVTCLTVIPERRLIGLSWSNLLWTCPFPSAAVGFSDIWPFLVREVPWLAAIPEIPLDWAVSAGVVLAVGLWAAAVWTRSRRNPAAPLLTDATAPPADRALLAAFTAAALLTTALTILLLVYMAVRTPLDDTWTYVVERRYFAVFYAFLGLALSCALAAFLRHRGGRWSTLAKSAIVALVLMWVAVGATWRVGKIVRHYCDVGGQQTLRRADQRECRQVSDTVRRHLDAGRSSLFIHPLGDVRFSSRGEKLEPVLAYMAGSPTVSYDSAKSMQLPPGKSVALLAVVPDAGHAQAAQAAEYVARQGGFKRSLRLRDGWLYESLWCAEHTARSSSPCPTR